MFFSVSGFCRRSGIRRRFIRMEFKSVRVIRKGIGGGGFR